MIREMYIDKTLGCLLGGLIGDAMGAPVEGWHYDKIKQEKGWIDDFEGDGTDDSAIKSILCEALIKYSGHITADEFAESFLNNPQHYNLFFVPVRNMFHKIQDEIDLPVNAGINNAASSSSAMCISPMGIVNACDPRQAAIETYDVAGLIHSDKTSFCRDAACAIAAAVAEAMKPSATVDTIIDAGTKYLHPKSAHVMTAKINEVMGLARASTGYEDFRERFYETCLYNLICDSRETVPCVFALFYLAQGDPVKAICMAANFGRDSDTLATMAGALAGAYRGVDALRNDWVAKVRCERQEELAAALVDLIELRAKEKREWLKFIE